MLYRVKPEYADLWGADITPETIISDSDLESITRGWEKTPADVMDQLIPVDDRHIEFVTYIIKHSESFPFTDEITLDSAELLLENALPEIVPAGLTAPEVVAIWNQLVHDESVMSE